MSRAGSSALILAAATLAAAGAWAQERQLLSSAPGRFGEDERGVRYLLFERGGDVQSAGDPDDAARLELEYARLCMAALAARPAPRRILIVGLGGGAMARWLRLHVPEAHVDAVEIDPAVVAAARRFFGLTEDAQLAVHVADGREFIERTGPAYDLVFLDAFGAGETPAHLATPTFFRAVAARLGPEGIVAINLSGPAENPQFPVTLASLRGVFPHLAMLRTAADENRVVLLRQRQPFTRRALVEAGTALTKEKHLRFRLGEVIDEAWVVAPPKAGR